MQRSVTISEVRASQAIAKASPSKLWRWIAIPLTWPLTVVAARLGLSPNQVTASRALLAAIAMICIAQPSSGIFAAGISIYLFAILLDGVDGNLCRLYDGATYFGKFIDGLTDAAGDLAFPVALSIHVWAGGQGDATVLLAGLACVFCHALTFVFVHRLPLFELSLKADRSGSGPDAARSAHPRLHALLTTGRLARAMAMFDERAMNAVFDIRYVALAAALLTDSLALYLWLLAGLYACVMLAFAAMRIATGYANLDVGRRSRSAA